MDELSFRRHIYADPNDNSAEIQDACKQDANKAKFKAEMEAFELQLQQTLNVDVPNNLSERILLGQSMNMQQQQKRKHRVHLALAASVAFAVGIGFQMFGVSSHYQTLGDHAIAHVQAEVGHIPSTSHYTQQQLNAKLANFGGVMTEQVAPIKFANFCDFDGVRSLHIVLQDGDHDVTIFVVPKESDLRSVPKFSNHQFQGRSFENDKASMVILTDHNTPVDKWQNKIKQAIDWQEI